jgi:hypothetical protein
MRDRGSRLSAAAFVVVTALAVPAAHAAGPRSQFVLSPEGNHLWAYDVASGRNQLVVRAVNGGDPGVAAPRGSDRRDINGQVCVTPDRTHVITGEDTVLHGGGGEGSHDPRIAGWAYLRITGSRLGAITVKQAGKLAPNAGAGPGYRGDPDNYGCGFLDTRRLLTTAIGNTLPGESANGQLLLWFAPFGAGYHRTTLRDGTAFYIGRVQHCEIDGTLATAGGIAVDRNGDVYVATNRPDGNGAPGAVWRYRGRWPRSPRECTPAFLAANIHREQVIPSVSGAPADPRATTPSAVVITPAHTLYVSSVFTGIVSEFSTSGQWLRDVYPVAPVSPPTGPTGRTPYGLVVTEDESLWIANLGIVVDQPAPDAGSVLRVRFTNGQPSPVGETMKSNLNFPDGLGVYSPK